MLPAIATKKVLVCDDDLDSQDLICVILRTEGYAVDSAANHSEFFSKYRDFHPDLILLDIAMPGHDGFWIADELQRLENKAPLIFVSAHNRTVYRLCAPVAGAIDYILKPFDPTVLLTRVANALRPDASSSNWFLFATCHNPSA